MCCPTALSPLSSLQHCCGEEGFRPRLEKQHVVGLVCDRNSCELATLGECL